MDFLEYSDIASEVKGCMTAGKLKMTDQSIIFKNGKTGKVESVPAVDFEAVNFQNFSGSLGIRIFLKNGTLHRFIGFKDSEKERIAKFFSSTYKLDMLEKELSLKGWNWGTAKFNGSVLSFEVGHNSAFEIPLNQVSQCTAGKNEITMEFHQNDDAPVSLMEMRFFIPSNELAGDVDPVEAFQKQVMKKASVISVSGDAIAIFREIQCLTPRGRYDIKIFQTFFQLHGKTFDYKIPMSTVLRLFLLPHKDNRQMFFVVSLDPPIKQGQTRYHFLVLLFGQEEETSIELPFSDEELKDKYENKLEKELSGPTYEVLGKVMKVIINRKLTGPGGFVGHSGTPAVSCSFKAAAGYLYPLERGFMYVHKPPIHIRFDEVASVNFARGGGSTRSFDFEIALKSGTIHTFSSIEKEEYNKLFDFITAKKLNIKNRGKNQDKAGYNDDFGDSDNEAPDAYLERVKAEAQERDEDDDNQSEDESTDEDFKPNQDESDVAEEFDSSPSSSSDEDNEKGSEDEHKSKDTKRHKRERKERKEKNTSSKTLSEKPRQKRAKKAKDENKPKRPGTAFMLWLNETREAIKSKNPGIKVTEIAKKGGEMWKELQDKSEWEEKAVRAKEEYHKAMKEYEASGGARKFEEKQSEDKKSASKQSGDKKSASKQPGDKKSAAKQTGEKKSASKKKSSSMPTVKASQIKSKEFIENDDSSSSSAEEKEKGSTKRKGSDDERGKKKNKKNNSENEESDAEPVPISDKNKDKKNKPESEESSVASGEGLSDSD